MKKIVLISMFSCSLFCNAQESSFIPKSKIPNSKFVAFVNANKENSTPSISLGTVSNGSLQNGKLIPFKGKNFYYFDTSSYINERAFVNDKLKKVIIATYKQLDTLFPSRNFVVMECSNKNGGKISPHKTHQNGLSIDFMIPLMKNNKAYYALDSLGANHYLLNFENNGCYSQDKSISVDFNLLAKYISTIEKNARKQGLKISKVILKTEYKNHLFASTNGENLKKMNIYFAMSLTPLLNALHDDHFHVDFELIK